MKSCQSTSEDSNAVLETSVSGGMDLRRQSRLHSRESLRCRMARSRSSRSTMTPKRALLPVQAQLPRGPVAAATEVPKLSRSASQRARRRAAKEIAAAGEAVSDDDISEPSVSLCRAWASGLGCQGGPLCPGLQYHKSPSPDELFAAQHSK